MSEATILEGTHRGVLITYDGKAFTVGKRKRKRLTLNDAISDIDELHANIKRYKVLVMYKNTVVRAQAEENTRNPDNVFISSSGKVNFLRLRPKKKTILDTPSNRVALRKIMADRKEYEKTEAALMKALEHVK